MTHEQKSNLWGTFWFFLGIYLIWAIGYGIVNFGFATVLIIGAIWFGIFGMIALFRRAKSTPSQPEPGKAEPVGKVAPTPPDEESPTQPSIAPISGKPQRSGRSGVAIGVIVAGFIVLVAIAGMFAGSGNKANYRVSSGNLSSWDDNDTRTVGAIRHWAEIGHSSAQFTMAYRFHTGQGVIQDFEQAFCWYQHAASARHPTAMNNLAFMYERGQGTEKDEVLAHKWYNLASAGGFEPAANSRSEVGKRLSEQQLKAAQLLAREWQPHRGGYGHLVGMPQLSRGQPLPLPSEDQERKYFCDMGSPTELEDSTTSGSVR